MLIDDPHPAGSDMRLIKIFAALADPGRLAAVRTLARVGELPCSRLQQEAGLEISRTTFTHHQRVLREAGIISVRVLGVNRLLSLRRAELDQRFPGLLDIICLPDHDDASTR